VLEQWRLSGLMLAFWPGTVRLAKELRYTIPDDRPE